MRKKNMLICDECWRDSIELFDAEINGEPLEVCKRCKEKLE